jgi:glycosyltransferase involved in cell wall biosynthesis
MISAVLITKNEEANLEDCLKSLTFCDEIVIVDNDSQDKTLEIAQKYNAKMISTKDWPGFGPQKQKAVDLALGPWILSIDADERVSNELRDEILQVLKNPVANGFYLPRLSYVCGVPIKHGGWYPDYILRLFKKSAGAFTKDIVHERVLVSGHTDKLKNHLIHYSYKSFEEVIHKYNHYSTLGSDKLYNKKPNAHGGFWIALARGLFAFFKMYILKLGFLDGKMGFILAVTSLETAFYKYLKLGLKKDGKI